jgi:hypothetical protein
MESDKVTSIPSDKDFARAERLDKERSRNLGEVNGRVEEFFKTRCPLHYFFLMPQRDDFRVYVFFKEDKDIHACEESGVSQEIIDFVYAELERVGRGRREDVRVAFEFDSDESVSAKYAGDYFLRLR